MACPVSSNVTGISQGIGCTCMGTVLMEAPREQQANLKQDSRVFKRSWYSEVDFHYFVNYQHLWKSESG